MKLPTSERAALVEGLALDALWLKEAECRIAAYRAGELEAVDAEEAFAELGRKVERSPVSPMGEHPIDPAMHAEIVTVTGI